MLTTSDTLNVLGGYDILGVIGFRNGATITGIASLAGPNPFTITSTPYNNVLYPSDPDFDDKGLLCQTAAFGSLPGNYYNIFFAGGKYIEAFFTPETQPSFKGSSQTLVYTENVLDGGGIERVPEPGAMALLVAGLIGLFSFGLMRKRLFSGGPT